MLSAFPPLVGSNAKVLILGTFPSVVSRQKDEYYANPQNKFWKIMFDIFGEEYTADYDVKKRLLLENGIALWDVIKECEIEGSLDSNIKNPVYEIWLPGFIREQGIKKVLFNGGNAYGFYRRGIKSGLDGVEHYALPSTSPANARMSYMDKLAAWRKGVE